MDGGSRRQPRDFRMETNIPAMLTFDRPLPHDEEAEVALLSCILMDPVQCFDDARATLVTSDPLYRAAHKEIYEACCSIADSLGAGAIDMITVSGELERRGRLEQVGGRSYVQRIACSSATSTNAGSYASAVCHEYERRQMVVIGTEIATKSFDKMHAMADVRSELAARVEASIRSGVESRRARVAFDEMVARLKMDGYFDLGIKQLEKHGSLMPGYGIIAGRSHHGKTALATSIALNNALSGKKVIYWNGEQDAGRTYLRMLCQLTQRHPSVILNEDKWIGCDARRIEEAHGVYNRMRMSILERRLTLDQLRAKVMKEADRMGGVDLIVLDQLSKVKLSESGRTTREQALSTVSERIDQWKEETQAMILLMVQLNIKTRDESSQTPHYWHVKDCGRLYEDADMWWTIDRPEAEVYRLSKFMAMHHKLKDAGELEKAEEYQVCGKMKVMCEKDRDALGSVYEDWLYFDTDCGMVRSAPCFGPDRLERAVTTTDEDRELDDQELGF